MTEEAHMATTENPAPLLTVDQLAERLGTTVRHVRRLVAERRVPYLKIGKFVRFDPDDVAAWLDQARHGPPTGSHRSPVTRDR